MLLRFFFSFFLDVVLGQERSFFPALFDFGFQTGTTALLKAPLDEGTENAKNLAGPVFEVFDMSEPTDPHQALYSLIINLEKVAEDAARTAKDTADTANGQTRGSGNNKNNNGPRAQWRGGNKDARRSGPNNQLHLTAAYDPGPPEYCSVCDKTHPGGINNCWVLAKRIWDNAPERVRNQKPKRFGKGDGNPGGVDTRSTDGQQCRPKGGGRGRGRGTRTEGSHQTEQGPWNATSTTTPTTSDQMYSAEQVQKSNR